LRGKPTSENPSRDEYQNLFTWTKLVQRYSRAAIDLDPTVVRRNDTHMGRTAMRVDGSRRRNADDREIAVEQANNTRTETKIARGGDVIRVGGGRKLINRRKARIVG
jgi:hypothetical protein